MIPSKAHLDRVMDCLGYTPWRGAGWYRTKAGNPSPSLVRLSIRGLTWNRLLVRLVDEFPDERETEITGCISQVRGSEDLTADEA